MSVKARELGWITNKMMQNPLASALIAVTVLWAGTAVVNAGFLQVDTHPAPLYATRGMAILPAHAVKGDRIQNNVSKSITESIFTSDPLIEELQIALAEKQFYAYELDGKMGPKTRSAIFAYQRAARLDETGKASGKLLAHIRMSNIQGNVISKAPEPRKTPIKSDSPDQQFLMKIQSGLRRFGFVELEIDGIYGSQTANAIRTFERQNGLDVTGEPNADVLQTLLEIGAI